MKISITHDIPTDAGQRIPQTITIEDDLWDLSFIDFMEGYIKPLSHALRYHHETIERFFDEV